MSWSKRRVGTSLSKAKSESARSARNVLIRYVQARVRSVYEVETYLKRRGYVEAVVKEVIEQAQSQKLLDDKIAAQLWAQHWMRSTYGPYTIRQKLRLKGFAESVCQAAMDALDPEEAHSVIADRLTRYWNRLEGQVDADERMKLLRKYTSRGYAKSTIDKIFQELSEVTYENQ